jgi:hypothetical protein
MNLQEIESTWAAQPAPASVDLDALRRRLTARLAQRRRVLVLGIVASVIGLLAMQAVSIANLHALRQSPPWTFALHLMMNQGVNLALLFELIRAFQRHRRLAGARADSTRAVLELSRRNVADQIWDFRFGRWIIPALAGTALLSAYLNNPVTHVGWGPFAGRAGFIVALFGLIATGAWHHYRRVLVPRRDELEKTLREMVSET